MKTPPERKSRPGDEPPAAACKDDISTKMVIDAAADQFKKFQRDDDLDALALLNDAAITIRGDHRNPPEVLLADACDSLRPLLVSRALTEADVIDPLTAAMTARGVYDAGDCVRAALGMKDGLRIAPDRRPELPGGFRYGKDGVIEIEIEQGDETEWRFLCSPIEIVAQTRDREQGEWGLLIRIKTPDGHWHELPFPRGALISGTDDALAALACKGLIYPPKMKEGVRRLLSMATPKARARCVPRVGWDSDGDGFVLPGQIIGSPEDGEHLVFQTEIATAHSYKCEGTFEGWKDGIARYADGNSRLTFAVALALAGPLLRIMDMQGGGFHLTGPSSIGKSTALHVAGSVWGGGGMRGFIRSWRSTDNALESLAVMHSDTILLLDELAEVDPKAAAQASYMLANGQGKTRAAKTGIAKKGVEWRTQFLSSGELSLADKLAEDGRRAMAGQEVRVINLAADAGAGLGLFEKLHDFEQPGDLADELVTETRLNFGHAGPAFVRYLIDDMHMSKHAVAMITKEWMKRHCPPEAEGQVRRVAQRFAIVAAAAVIASRASIAPWTVGAASNMIGQLFAHWIAERGGADNSEIGRGIAQVRDMIERYGSSRFQPWDDPGRPISDRVGFVRHDARGTEYFILPDAWKRICAPFDSLKIAKAMADMGMIARGGGRNIQQKPRLPGMGNQSCYVIAAGRLSPHVLDGGDC